MEIYTDAYWITVGTRFLALKFSQRANLHKYYT